MPLLRLPDGAALHWEERGEGPLVVFGNQFFNPPRVFEDLLRDLARDHRVVTYDVRGTTPSPGDGPYELEQDASDLCELAAELGPPAILVAVADACNRAVKLAGRRPDLVSAVVSPGGNPIGRSAAAGTDSLVGSQSVLEALQEMIATDYRGALRTMIATANPQLQDEGVRTRVSEAIAYCPQHVAVERLRSWITDDSTQDALAMGNRFWMLEHGTNAWFPIDVARRTREFLPEAHVLEVENGPLSRPDITAGCVRRISAGQALSASAESSRGS